MGQSQVFLTSLQALLLVFLQTAAGNTVSSCLGQNSNNRSHLAINCGPGYMVHITRAFYGFSATGQCRLVEGRADSGCLKDDKVDYGCVGGPRCDISLPQGPHGPSITDCGQRSNYFQVNYECVPVDSVHDICQEEMVTGQSGYIRTPSYPVNYRQQGVCTIRLMVQSKQKIRLKIIDMELQDKGHTDCADYIYFNNNLRSITLCSRRNNNTYYWRSNYLKIELQSTSGGLSKGFWLYYEAFPPLPTTLPRPDVRPPPIDATVDSTQDNSDDNNGNNNNNRGETSEHKGDNSYEEPVTSVYKDPLSTVPLIRNSRHRSSKLPFAAIAGGVIGTLSLILVILLLMLLVKWLRERQYYRAEKILEIRNPAFRSSGDFYEQQQQQQQQPNNSDYNYC